MYKIAVVGDRESVISFRVLGLEAVPVSTAEEASEALRRMSASDYAVIYLTEQFAEPLKDELSMLEERVTPAVILIPGAGGSLGVGLSNISDAVERAVGTNILGDS